jgi:signal transduction histidine kinase
MKPTWPFIPDHITFDRKELRGSGIVSQATLEGIIVNSTNILQNIISVVEFPVNDSEKPIRTRPHGLRYSNCLKCRTFLEKTGRVPCEEYEDTIADLFRDCRSNNVLENVMVRIDHSNKIKGWKEIHDYHIEPKEIENSVGDSRVYLETDCPFQGFRNIIYPIFFSDRIIGLYCVGELNLSYRSSFIDYCQEKANRDFNLEKFSAKPETINSSSSRDEKYIDEENYSWIISAGKEQVSNIEYTLYRKNSANQNKYISEKTREYSRSFFTSILNYTKDQLTGAGGLSILWNEAESLIRTIQEDFKIKSICLFGLDEYTFDTPQTFKLLRNTGELPEEFQQELVAFDFTKVSSLTENSPVVDSKAHPELCEDPFSVGSLNHERFFVRLLSLPISPPSSVVTVITYNDDWNPLVNKHQRESGIDLDYAIRPVYRMIVSTHASIFAATSERNMKTSLKVFGHELGQITTALDGVKNNYFIDKQLTKKNDIKLVQSLSREATGIIFRDIDTINMLIQRITTQANMTFKLPVPQISMFSFFKEILFKWKGNYEGIKETEQKQIVVAIPDSNDSLRPSVLGDKILLEQMTYNLVSNAVKYSYRGTNIHLDCFKKDTNPDSPHYLTVVNYGRNITDKEEIFKMFVRSEDVDGIEGLGVGLSIARSIAKAHNGRLWCATEKVSDYNVPFFEAYMDYDFNGKRNEIFNEVRKTKEGLSDEEYRHIVATRRSGESLILSDHSPSELIESIEIPIWKVTFTFEF